MKIKNILSFILTLGLFAALAQVDRSKLPEPATPRPIQIGDYETFELKNGLKVFIIENHKLPRVTYNLVVDVDPLLEGEKAGYLGMVGQMMRRGTDTRTKEQIDEEIDFIGATLGAGSSSVFASGLSKYNEKILELMTDVVFNPTFPEEELEKIRKQELSNLAAAKEDPGAISGNLNNVLVYGKNHPYGENQTEETTNNITVSDLKNYHAKYFKPNISYLAIVGDVDPKAMKKLVKTYFEGWQKGEVEKATYPTPKAPEKVLIGVVNRPSAVQSNISITYPVDLIIGSGDEIKARVMNEILGGSGSAKLFMNLREDKGYTYGSYSSLRADELVGRFNATAEVRNEVTDSALVQMFYEMDQMKKGNISDAELTLAKNSIAGDFSISLERPQTVANFALNTAIYGYPQDYYATYLQKVQAVTKEDVQAMAQKYLKTENAYITVVGKTSEVIDKLKPFGEIKYYDNYGNEIDPSLSKIPAGLTAEKVIQSHLTAIGGKEKLSKIKSVKMKMEGSVMGQTMNMAVTKASPNLSYTEVSMGGNVVQKMIFDGEKGRASGMQGTQDMTGDDALDMALSSSLFPELIMLDKGVKMEISSLEQIDGKDAYGIEVTMPSGKKAIRYYDKESGLFVRETSSNETPNGTITLSTDIVEYSEFGGVKFATLIKQPINPQIKMDVKVLDVIVNEEVDPSIFSIE